MKKNISKRIFLVLFTFLFLLLLNFFYKEYVTSIQNKKSSFIKKVENQIHRKEKIAKNILDELIYNSTYNSEKNLFSNERIYILSEKEAISFLVYSDDTLVYWSENVFSAPQIINKNSQEKQFVKTDNGWYFIIKKEINKKTFYAAILIKYNYKYENDYLKNQFNKDIQADIEDVEIIENDQKDFITSTENQKLFSLSFKESKTYTITEQTIIFIIYILMFFTLIYLLYLLHRFFYEKNVISKTFFVLAFIIDLIILKGLLFYFKIPANVYDLNLFGPLYYASSSFLPSFGDLLINTILFFIIAVFLYKNLIPKAFVDRKKSKKILLLFIILSFLAIFFMYIISLIQSIILDSTISYNLNQLFTINGISVLGLLIISMLILSYFLVAIVLLRFSASFKLKHVYVLIFLFFNGIFWGILNPFSLINSWPTVICFVAFGIIYYLFRVKNEAIFHYYEILTYLLIFTITVYYTLNISNNRKEIEKRKSFAHKLSSGEDPLAENIFKDVQKQIIDDRLLKEKLVKYPLSEYEIKEYLTKKYFSGYWDKYKVQITLCNSVDSLVVESDPGKQNCKLFFDDIINNFGKPSSCKNLFVLNYGTGGNNYISEMDFTVDSSLIFLFIELNSKFIPKGLGYPELLIDKKLFINTDLSNYSFAKYYKNNLIDAYGKYYYSTNYYINDSSFVNDFYFFNYNGYNHLCYKTDNSSIVLISKKNGNILDVLAPFSILFTFFSIVLLIFCLFEIIIPKLKSLQLDFKNRLQISMVSIIFISFMIIGISTFYFIRNLDENKNIDLLSEKTMSILIELQRKIGEGDTMSDEQLTVLSNALIRFSNVFFTDINVFDTKGKLVSSSRPQIFNEGLLSNRMNSYAYNQLIAEKKTLFIHKESIGKLQYYSAYAPFYGKSNKVLYYINLPYFAKEGELKKELSSFLTAFVNIYMILIAITILIALFIAGRITRPLNVIREKIGNIKLGRKNEKIIWPKRDEIGGLISEYNRMIDELAESAEILSRSERESAWRVMAMQVAHEIKNPLTPMKLSVQHLERSWKDKAPDWDTRLERFTKNIIEQIENLAAIASEFSYFAQMPKPQNEKIDIISLVTNSVSIFMANTNINISFDKKRTLSQCFVFADKKQLIRVMNNILTNSIQAIGNNKDGCIEIGIYKKNLLVIIYVKDNGEGISDEMKPKIFTPNFSTKSEGMGLGLAIVKGIIENSGGKIWFESEHGTGTTFYVELPLYTEKED